MSRRPFGNVRQLPSGRYQARYQAPDGSEQIAPDTFTSRKLADRWLAAQRTDRERGVWIDDRLGRITFATWLARWRPTVVDLRPSTLARDDGYIERYLLPTFGTRQLAQIRNMHVRAWVAELSGRGLAPATVVKAGQIMGKVMRAAVQAGLIVSSPCDGVRLPRVERAETRFLAPAEVVALADAMDDRYAALVYLAAYGGLRVGELFGLRAKRVDLLRARLEVAEAVVSVAGRLHFGPPKTSAGRRSVPLPKVVCSALSEHLTSYPAAPEELVFTAPEGGPVRLELWRARYWRPAVRRATLEPLRPHDLRHTAVALWIEAGANPKEIAARAGHSSVVTVLDRYGHRFAGSEDRVNDALDALANAARPVPLAPVVAIGAGPEAPSEDTNVNRSRHVPGTPDDSPLARETRKAL